jgi:hypothetical protein
MMQQIAVRMRIFKCCLLSSSVALLVIPTPGVWGALESYLCQGWFEIDKSG